MRGLRPDLAIMDAPLIYHLPKFLFFLVIQGILIAVGVVATGASATPRMHACMRLLQSSTGARRAASRMCSCTHVFASCLPLL